MTKTLICKNNDCKSKNFKQLAPDKFECLNCGRIRIITNKQTIIKSKSEISKESITISKTYSPLTVYCESCGEKIDRIGHPRDEKRMNNKWANHTCSLNAKPSNFYQ